MCSCRFVSPGKTPPALTEEDAGDNFFVFNATCMQEVRENILSAIDQPIPNLLRPDNTNTAGGAGGPDDWAQADMPAYDDAMEKSLTFLRAQWAGTLPTDYATNGNEWRKAGFVDKDNGCPASLGGSFATGGVLTLRFFVLLWGYLKACTILPSVVRLSNYSLLAVHAYCPL